MDLEIDWEILLYQMEHEQCVLSIGPDIFSRSKEDRLEMKLAKNLRENEQALGIRVYDDGWFHYLENRNEFKTWFVIKRFYENETHNETKL